MAADIAIHQLDPEDHELRGRWDRFVLDCPRATFFHLTGWMRVITRTFSHEPFYVYAESNGSFCGVLPLILVKSQLFGKMLVSTAFAAYGGAAADTGEIEKDLLREAIRVGERLGVDYVEFRPLENGVYVDGLHGSDLYVTFRQQLFDDSEKNLSLMPREARRLVRRAADAGLEAEFSRHRLNEFYHVYASSVRNLGTPVFPKALFKNFLEEFPESSDILCIWLGEEVIASVFTFYYRDTVLPYYGGSLKKYNNNRLAPNNYMYWTLIRRGSEQGYQWFDFGRSKVGTGSYNFKRHFGMKPEQLNYQYALLRLEEMPNLNPLNPKYRSMIEIWKHLPLTVTKLVGPGIVKNIP